MFYERFCPFVEDEEDLLLDGLERLVDYFGPFQAPPRPRVTPAPVTILAIEERSQPRRRAGRSQSQGGKPNLLKRKLSDLEEKSCCLCNCHNHEEDKADIDKTKGISASTSEDLRVKKTKKDNIFEERKRGGAFEVSLEVDPRYKPGELKVKLSRDNRSLIVEGSHQESRNNEFGFTQVSTQLYQRFSVPDGVNVDALQCDLNGRGKMVISAPAKVAALEANKPASHSHSHSLGTGRGKEVVIPISRGGTSANDKEPMPVGEVDLMEAPSEETRAN